MIKIDIKFYRSNRETAYKQRGESNFQRFRFREYREKWNLVQFSVKRYVFPSRRRYCKLQYFEKDFTTRRIQTSYKVHTISLLRSFLSFHLQLKELIFFVNGGRTRDSSSLLERNSQQLCYNIPFGLSSSPFAFFVDQKKPDHLVARSNQRISFS